MTVNYEKLWGEALMEIELNVSRANFITWFKNTGIAKEENGIIFLNVPNTFVKEWLSTKYSKFILRALNNIYHSV
ncbi:chromosomal replication initiator protein DnaA, partial [Patescibacteria group bacterium]|nr:chromosomal replication initiator protein DnaA [Patescibacteria group bacterium]